MVPFINKSMIISLSQCLLLFYFYSIIQEEIVIFNYYGDICRMELNLTQKTVKGGENNQKPNTNNPNHTHIHHLILRNSFCS